MALTLGAITGAIGSGLGNVGSVIITVFKIIASVAFAVIFAGVIMTFLGMIQTAVFTSVVGEVFGILSMCLPFSPAIVFSGIWVMCDAILVFLIGRKVYILTSDLIKTSGGA